MILKSNGEPGNCFVPAKGSVHPDDPHRLEAFALTVNAPFGRVPRSYSIRFPSTTAGTHSTAGMSMAGWVPNCKLKLVTLSTAGVQSQVRKGEHMADTGNNKITAKTMIFFINPPLTKCAADYRDAGDGCGG